MGEVKRILLHLDSTRVRRVCGAPAIHFMRQGFRSPCIHSAFWRMKVQHTWQEESKLFVEWDGSEIVRKLFLIAPMPLRKVDQAHLEQ